MGLGFTGDEQAVLFVDDAGWASFDQVAVSLKRRGVRTVRVVVSEPARFGRMMSEPRLRWAADRLFYDEVICLSTAEGRSRLAALAATGVIADAVIAEPTLLHIGMDSPEGRLLTAGSMAFRGTPPATLLNKLAVNEILLETGIPIPVQISSDTCSPADAVDRLGLPLIVKTPIGASGYGVRLVRTLHELTRALASLSLDGQTPFYQQYIDGTVVMYAAVLGAGGEPLIEHGFKVERSQGRLGPSASISVYDRPEVVQLGRRAVRSLRPEGFAAFGFMETGRGDLFHIDANIRVWGNIVSALKVGIDYLDAYAASVRKTRWEPPLKAAATHGPLNVYPYTLMEAARSGAIREIASQASDFLRVCHGPLGSRYCLEVLGEASLHGLKRFRRSAPITVADEGLA